MLGSFGKFVIHDQFSFVGLNIETGASVHCPIRMPLTTNARCTNRR